MFAGGTAPRLTNVRLSASTRDLCLHDIDVLHSGVTRTPLWSAEHLTRSSVAAARDRDVRDNRFHAEPALPPSERAEIADYVHSGYDRGHMAPSGDMGDPASDHDSFSLANVVPQTAALNRGGWAAMEEYVRGLTTTLGEAYVVTGPLYEGARVRRIGGRVLVPTSTWKAVWVPQQGAGAWIATNEARPVWRVISIAELTRRSGIDPFPALNAGARTRVPAFPDFGSRTRHGRRTVR